LKHYSPENLFLMTAKKNASATSRGKSTKANSAAKKPATKKTASKAVTAKKPAPAKKPAVKQAKAKPAAKKPTAKKAASKAVTAKKPVPAKKPAVKQEKAKPAAKKPTEKKAASKAVTSKKPAPAKKTAAVKSATLKGKAKIVASKASAVAKLREIAAKTVSIQESKEEKAENIGFSIEEVRLLLSSRTKSASKKVKQEAVEKVLEKKKVPKAKSKVSKVKKITSASIDDILGFGVPTINEKQVRRDESKVPKQWLSYYQALISMRNALKGSLGERSNETIGASARESGELSLNSSDAGTETFDRDLALSMVANDHEALEEIEDAIDRIFDGSYGICQQTKKPINKSRLRAVPFTRFSLEGQNLFENNNRKERDQGAGSFATISDSTMGQDD